MGLRRRYPHGGVSAAVIATLQTKPGEAMPLAEIYAGARRRLGVRVPESSVRMALQMARPRTENTRRGFWRLVGQ